VLVANWGENQCPGVENRFSLAIRRMICVSKLAISALSVLGCPFSVAYRSKHLVTCFALDDMGYTIEPAAINIKAVKLPYRIGRPFYNSRNDNS
jgi:hypothetical protein